MKPIVNKSIRVMGIAKAGIMGDEADAVIIVPRQLSERVDNCTPG